ncbi:MAG: ABC transporter ATP-binding protein [Candidatus Sumerlaeia bacterium]|nr:ABC transporter ATP-binding protein [Candidatus Sumerlaeia bacterium]
MKASLPTTDDPLGLNFRSTHPVRTLFRLLKLNPVEYSILFVVYTIKHSPVWLLPIFVAHLIDVLGNPDAAKLPGLLGLGLGVVVLLAMNIPLQVYFFTSISRDIRQMETRLRAALVTRLHHLSFSFLDSTKSGKLQSKILRDVEQLQTMCFHLAQFAPMAITNLLVAILYTSIQEPLMLGFFALQVPLSLLLIRFFRKTMNSRNEAYRTQLESMNASVSESIEMIPVTRAHGVEEYTQEELGARFTSVQREGQRLDQFNALFGACSWVTFQLSMVNALAVSAYFAWHGYITVGEVVLYQGFFGLIVGSIESIINSVPIAFRGMESLRSIGEVLECPDLERNEGKERVGSVNGAVEFESVEYTYPEDNEPTLKGLSLRVQPGETIALVGESGSGKTTLMSLLIGFRRPQNGRVLLDGVPMEQLDMRTFRRHIAVVPQQPLLFSGSLRENVAHGLPHLTDEEVMEALEAASLLEVVSELPQGIHTRLSESGMSLSGGQRQRVAIARAFARNPRLIILDEATSALDVQTEREVQEAILRLAKGRTTFIIAHRLSTIRHANRIIVLGKGRILEEGTHEELLQKGGAFADLWRLQN